MATGLLVADAELVRGLSAAAFAGSAWRRPAFARRVAAVRRQLEPLTAERLVAEAFGREAMHVRPQAAQPGPVRIAYAIRLLEVQTGGALPDWTSLVDACVERR